MIPSFEDLRTRVREMRTELELTQSEAAEAADVSQSFVAKLEQGASQPNYAAAARLYNTLQERLREDAETAADVMTTEVTAVAPDDTVADASQRLKAASLSQLPVMEGDRCVGSVTTQDLLAADPDDPVRDHASAPFPAVQRDASTAAVQELLSSAPAVLVRSPAGDLAGIVTTADLL